MRILERAQPFLYRIRILRFFMAFSLGGKKNKDSQYLNEVQNGCTRSRIRIGQIGPPSIFIYKISEEWSLLNSRI